MNKIKICFVIPSLRAGGAERVMSFLAEHIDKKTFSSELLIIESEKDKSYEIKDIPITYLNKNRVRDGIWAIAKHLKRNKVDIAVSSMGHVNTLMAILSIFSNKTKFVGREAIVRSATNKVQGLPLYPTPLSKLIYKVQMRYLDAIICQSNDMRDDLYKNYGFPNDKLITLNNPITHQFRLKKNRKRNDIIQLITVGRFAIQKGHLRLLKALSRYNMPFHYTMIGSGEGHEKIFAFIDEHGLSDKITHVPFTDNVQQYLEKSDLYLLGSYVEGFPNSLLEACAVGTPVLAFKAPGGIDEIIIEGVNGYLADNEEDFLKKLEKSVKKEWVPEAISKSVTDRYSAEIILEKYKNFFLDLHSQN
ncbi:glycosyltransferase [Pareuzebyella sediminis]|uniref:glycosyltransferase n=1 Tax=Pareuzebyella sediminis TaxID=2607998 RepID=UPI0011F05D88|nr:glycosyltransferase [Pareuzebyella sediminis]